MSDLSEEAARNLISISKAVQFRLAWLLAGALVTAGTASSVTMLLVKFATDDLATAISNTNSSYIAAVDALRDTLETGQANDREDADALRGSINDLTTSLAVINTNIANQNSKLEEIKVEVQNSSSTRAWYASTIEGGAVFAPLKPPPNGAKIEFVGAGSLEEAEAVRARNPTRGVIVAPSAQPTVLDGLNPKASNGVFNGVYDGLSPR